MNSTGLTAGMVKAAILKEPMKLPNRVGYWNIDWRDRQSSVSVNVVMNEFRVLCIDLEDLNEGGRGLIPCWELPVGEWTELKFFKEKM